jgi:hypothetical protein
VEANDMSWTGRLGQFFRRDQDDPKKQDRRVATAQLHAKIAAERARSQSKQAPT